jgi:hypothetical protein
MRSVEQVCGLSYKILWQCTNPSVVEDPI